MATKKSPKQVADDLAGQLQDTLARVIHARDKDAIRRAANNASTWSLDTGADEGSNDRYMKNIGKGAIKVQQMGMQDTADDENDKYNKKAVPGSFKKGGKVKKTGFAKVHKGEKVITVKQQKKAERKKGGK